MKIKIGNNDQLYKAFRTFERSINNNIIDYPSVLPYINDYIKNHNAIYYDVGSTWKDDILEFPSEEDYFLFLMRWL